LLAVQVVVVLTSVVLEVLEILHQHPQVKVMLAEMEMVLMALAAAVVELHHQALA
jgi:hypothetical protein